MPLAKTPIRLTAAALLTATLPLGAAAFDMGAMSDKDREAFRAEVRAYLLEHPEVLMEAVDVYQQQQAEAQSASDAEMIAANSEALFNTPTDLVLGNPEGDIVLVEFVDYRCGYCKKAFPEVRELVEKDGNIKLIVKEFPILGEASVLASRFAIATKQVAGDEAYHKLNAALMGANNNVSEASLRRLATGLEIDADAVLAKMDSDEVNAVIAANHTLGGALQISGTPTFVLGSEMLRGYVPYDAMKEIVAEVRAAQ